MSIGLESKDGEAISVMNKKKNHQSRIITPIGEGGLRLLQFLIIK